MKRVLRITGIEFQLKTIQNMSDNPVINTIIVYALAFLLFEFSKVHFQWSVMSGSVLLRVCSKLSYMNTKKHFSFITFIIVWK